MKILKSVVLISTLVMSTGANAALLERLGGLAYYDDVANLTWMTDASAAGIVTGFANANSWAAGLSVAGISGWRLPTAVPLDSSCDSLPVGFNCTGNELGNLFYNVLGNTAGLSSASSLVNTGPFTNIQTSSLYWTSTEFVSDTTLAYMFDMGIGFQELEGKTVDVWTAWAVHDGDVSAVPLPASVWLLASGLLGIAGVARRKKY